MWWIALLWMGGEPELDDALRRALSVRHDPPTCSALAEDSGRRSAAQSAVRLVETEAQPPWVPLRAVGCLVEWADEPEVAKALAHWLDSPGHDGTGVAVARSIDRAPSSEVAERLASQVMGREWDRGTLGESGLRALKSSEHPAVVKLVVRLSGE